MKKQFIFLMLSLGFISHIFSDEITIKNEESLLHIGSLDSFELTPDGIEAARLLWEGIKNNDKKQAQKAIAIYKNLIPKENFGGEYTGILWLAQYYFFPEKYPISAVKNPFYIEYYHFFLDNNADVLKEYLVRKYKLQKIQDKSISDGLEKKVMLEDYILFNNPLRENWEKTSVFLNKLDIKPGTVVGDVGCGPGVYSYFLSLKTGEKGLVYAMDLNKNHLKSINKTCEKYKIKNIKTHVSGVTSTKLPENTLDSAVMCSLYHIIYAEAEEERHAFITSLKATLKDGGLLFVIDNSPVTGDTLPYHSNYIDKQLIIEQLRYYGFELISVDHIIPQRYLLTFKNVKGK